MNVSSFSPLIAVSDKAVACWVTAGAGLAVAAVCWGTFLGIRASSRQRRDGRSLAAGLTGVLAASWLVGGFALVWVGLSVAL